ncbi:hypothetical protein GCK32_010886 [Trichostrongylus colubriformis]|uniref:DUF4708 domain-containing protein n=1 Tax=Trichostrongylus colubriformis TaxID=6319 RepID=A0AAN8F7E3_TRICO
MFKLCSVDLEKCRVLHLEIYQNVDGRSASPHGIQQKMCRDILSAFSFSGTLAAPKRDLKEIMVVGRVDYISNTAEEFQHWLQQHCVTIKSVDRADSSSLEECLRYSLVAWLESHQYYRCGEALVKGPFLGTNPFDVISILYALQCNSVGEVYLRISPETLRLIPLESWQIQDSSAEPRWVYCLPRLGRGQLLATYRHIPPDSAFANYAEMRAYWKNCHGYDLPLEEPENYYSVWFNGIKSSFLYPDFCVLASKPQPIGFVEDQKITLAAVDEFSKVFSSKEHFICGERCELFPSDVGFIRPLDRALKTIPYSRRTAPNVPSSFCERYAAVATKHPKEPVISAAEGHGSPSPTKRYAAATNTSVPYGRRVSFPDTNNQMKARQILLGTQSYTGTVRSRKRHIDVE